MDDTVHGVDDDCRGFPVFFVVEDITDAGGNSDNGDVPDGFLFDDFLILFAVSTSGNDVNEDAIFLLRMPFL